MDTRNWPGMTSCCDKHDICYDTCGTNRDDCDKNFKKCLKDMCRDLKSRKNYSKQQLDGEYVTNVLKVCI